MSKQQFSEGDKFCTYVWLSALVLAGLAAFNVELQAQAAEPTIGQLIAQTEIEADKPAPRPRNSSVNDALLGCGDDPLCIEIEMRQAGYVWKKKWVKS